LVHLVTDELAIPRVPTLSQGRVAVTGTGRITMFVSLWSDVSAGTSTILAVRHAPHLPVQVLGTVLLVCLGLLLGTTWTIQALQAKLRRQAEERRRLNAEWAAIRTIRWQETVCPRCASPLSKGNRYIVPTPVAELDDDN
jgi:hypothetical protein